MDSLIVTLIGPDRPGLVGQLSDTVAREGGNWLQSRMSHLAGKFAGVVHVEIDAARVESLRRALAELERTTHLRLVVETTGPIPTQPEFRTAVLDLVGQDRPGIIREISQFLAERGINVEDLATDRESAAMSGEWLFRARARVALPASATTTELRAGLERIANDLMVEIHFTEQLDAHT